MLEKTEQAEEPLTGKVAKEWQSIHTELKTAVERMSASPLIPKELAATIAELVEDTEILAHEEEMGIKTSPMPVDLKSNLHFLIKEHSPLQAEDFLVRCRQLINTHGFPAFKNAFDEVLADKKTIHYAKRHAHFGDALREINQLIIDTTATTFESILLEGAKIQANGVMSILNEPRENFAEEAKKLAEEDKYNEVRTRAKQRAQADAEKQIKELAEDVPNREEAIADINTHLEAQLRELDEAETLPLDFYIEKARLKKVDKSRQFFNTEGGHLQRLVCDHIREDILSKPTPMLRTIVLERYILTAERLLQTNRADAASAIFTAINCTPINRLHATHEGLSQHAREQYHFMTDFFGPKLNYKKVVDFCKENDAYIPPNIIASLLEFSIDKIIQLHSDGSLKQGVLASNSFLRVADNKRKTDGIVIAASENKAWADEIRKNRLDFSNKETFDTAWKTKGAQEAKMDDRFYKESLALESREKPPKASNVMKKAAVFMHQPPASQQLITVLHDLLLNFNSKKRADFEKGRDALITQYGVVAFKSAFDDVLITRVQGKVKAAAHYDEALQEVNQHLVGIMATTFSAMVMDGAKKQAQGFLRIISQPSKELMGIIQEFLTKVPMADPKAHFQAEARKAIESIKADTAIAVKDKEVAIAQIEQNLIEQLQALELIEQAKALAGEDYAELREVLKEKVRAQPLELGEFLFGGDEEQIAEQMRLDREEQIKALDSIVLPLDYYIEKARFKNLAAKKEEITAEAARAFDLIGETISQDILASPSLDKRTLALERYLLLAEHYIKSEQLPELFTIYGALKQMTISRLDTAMEGLTAHSKGVLAEMDKIFSNDKNSQYLRHYTETHDTACMPPAYIAKYMIFLVDNPFSKMVAVDEQGNITQSLAEEGACQKIISNSNKVLKTQSTEHAKFREEINKNHDALMKQLSGGKENVDLIKEAGTYFYQLSLEREPRLAAEQEKPKPSKIAKKSKHLLREELDISKRMKKNADKIRTDVNEMKAEREKGGKDRDPIFESLQMKLLLLIAKIQTLLAPLFAKIDSAFSSSKATPNESIAKTSFFKNISAERKEKGEEVDKQDDEAEGLQF